MQSGPPHAVIMSMALSLLLLTSIFVVYASSESVGVASLESSDVIYEKVFLTSMSGDDQEQNPPLIVPSAPTVLAQSLSQVSDFKNPPAESFNENASKRAS